MTTEMPMKRLGTSGLVVSRLALGTMTFGDRTDAGEARRIFDEAMAAGVNFVDTADTYAKGASERITGELIRARRNELVLATKVANPNGPGPNQRGLSRKWIMEEVEASLGRLGTDFIDILYLHKEDHGTRPEETLRALADLQRAGKIRYWGLSNFKSWRIARMCALADGEGIDRPVASQPLYHALNRAAEVEQLPACAAHGMGVVVYSPTARGVLTGKYRTDAAPPEGSRAALQNKRMLETEFQPDNLAAAERFVAHARARGAEPAALALAWVLANPLVTSVLAGPRTVEHWRTYLSAIELGWTAEDEAAIDAIVSPGTTAIPQFADPAYPAEGRPAD